MLQVCPRGLRLPTCRGGTIDLDAPIATYWPAFGDHGKAAITLRVAMSHRAGLPGQLGFADAAREVGFAYLSNPMGGYGDARAGQLTLALGRVAGA